MAYDAVAQFASHELDVDADLDADKDADNDSPSPDQQFRSSPHSKPSPCMDMLFMDQRPSHHENSLPMPMSMPMHHMLSNSGFLSNTTATTTATRSILSRSTRSYDLVDGSERDPEDFTFSGNTSPLLSTSEGSKGDDLFVPRRRYNTDSATSPTRFEHPEEAFGTVTDANIPLQRPLVRTASTRGVKVRHPTPGLQTLQGAYTANVVHLEETAEKLSMTSSIEDSIRHAYEEQKRSDSRKSSMRQSSLMNIITDFPHDTMPMQLTSPIQFTSPTSILDVNSAARSGGYSPGGAVIMPARARADSKSSKTSKYGTRPEPEMEGRPLGEFVPLSRKNSYLSSRNPSLSASLAEKVEEVGIRRPLAIRNPSSDDVDVDVDADVDIDDERKEVPGDRLVTFDSHSELENAQKIFEDFDGQHYANSTAPAPISRPVNEARRVSSANTLSMARPKSYADPLTGQQMVFYPAPVPSMLQLPQKLSNRPSPATRDRRRTQVLDSVPAAARQSAVCLPDVVEAANDETESFRESQYLPQHHRQITGGRRTTQDMSLLPEQLRANTFFEQPTAKQVVEIKSQSAVKTLDDILDASAFAPVSAFTDHAFAGRLGAEVYGIDDHRKTRTKSQLLGVEPQSKQKRASSFFGLGGDKSSEKLHSRRNTTVSGILGLNNSPTYEPVENDKESPRLAGDDELEYEDEPEQMDERYAEEMYTGAPTTLLAELQLRKQQAKARTQPTLLPGGFRSTLLEMDAVAHIESKTRQQKRITLAWQDKAVVDEQAAQDDDEDDVPLGVLFPEQARQQQDNSTRPMGLLERRELEDNEPLSKRRDRLLGRQPIQREPLHRASTMLDFPTRSQFANGSSETITPGGPRLVSPETEEANPLPSARPVSGDFTTEMLHQFGGETPKEKGEDAIIAEENETLGQRRRRLIAEREAREREVGGATPEPDLATQQRPVIKQRRSMADILAAHPASAQTGLRHYASRDRLAGRNSSLPMQDFPHLREHQQHQQQQIQWQRQAQVQPAMYGGASMQSPDAGFAPGMYQRNGVNGGLGMNHQGQMGVGAGVGGFAGQGAGMGMGNQSEEMVNRMVQMRVRAQQQQGGMMGGAPGQAGWPGQQVQWQNWARMQGMGMGMGMGMAGGVPGQPGSGGVDMVERWRNSVMTPGG